MHRPIVSVLIGRGELPGPELLPSHRTVRLVLEHRHALPRRPVVGGMPHRELVRLPMGIRELHQQGGRVRRHPGRRVRRDQLAGAGGVLCEPGEVRRGALVSRRALRAGGIVRVLLVPPRVGVWFRWRRWLAGGGDRTRRRDRFRGVGCVLPPFEEGEGQGGRGRSAVEG